MGCSGCGNSESGKGGCSSGSCGSSSGGCGKLEVFDWLSDIQLPNGRSQFDIVEIRFKNTRKSFFRNLKDLPLNVGDVVVVEASPGYDIGVISVVGELARIQVQKKSPNFKRHEAKQVLRHASQAEIDKWVKYTKMEKECMLETRKIASQLGLEMKISDVEFQADGIKATFYYIAEGRVDFRELIKRMANAFHIRIEMKQIGARQEAAMIGGISSCGRELCCSTWLTDFRTVSTSAARYQQLSLNPEKLAGQCGKLKCCLNYELDMYVEALKGFPSTDKRIYAKNSHGIHIKTDVFKRLMWYLCQTNDDIPPILTAFTPEKVQAIISMNEKGKKPDDFTEFGAKFQTTKDTEEPILDYTKVVGQDDLHRFDNQFKKKKRKKNKNKKNPVNTVQATPQNKPKDSNNTQKSKKPRRKKNNNKLKNNSNSSGNNNNNNRK